jgi:hypothetical protein
VSNRLTVGGAFPTSCGHASSPSFRLSGRTPRDDARGCLIARRWMPSASSSARAANGRLAPAALCITYNAIVVICVAHQGVSQPALA